jgi:hypothetical protein
LNFVPEFRFFVMQKKITNGIITFQSH